MKGNMELLNESTSLQEQKHNASSHDFNSTDESNDYFNITRQILASAKAVEDRLSWELFLEIIELVLFRIIPFSLLLHYNYKLVR